MEAHADGPCTVWTHEHTPEELNTVKQCSTCGISEMLIRDPRNLSNGSVFSYCLFCGTAYRVVSPHTI